MSTNGSGEFPQQPGEGQIQPHQPHPAPPPHPSAYPSQPGPYPNQYPGQPGKPGQYPAQYYDPSQQYHPQTPYLQQPVQQQYFAQPGAAPVNYIVQAQSLKGVRGWLIFFLLWAGLSALSTGSQLPWAFEYGGTIGQIFMPLLLIASIAAIVTTALELRIGKWVFIAWAVLWFGYNVAQTTDTASEFQLFGGETIATVVIVSALFTGFVVLYFLTSKRVKETLVK